jgi:TPR repeat protein
MTSAAWKDAEEAWERGLSLYEAGDYPGAIAAYEFAARRNHSCAQVNLGTLLDDNACPPDPEGAVYWYRKAVDNGESAAAYNLAIHYEKLGNPDLAMEWMKQAAAMGDSDAVEKLSEAKKTGTTNFRRCNP